MKRIVTSLAVLVGLFVVADLGSAYLCRERRKAVAALVGDLYLGMPREQVDKAIAGRQVARFKRTDNAGAVQLWTRIDLVHSWGVLIAFENDTLSRVVVRTEDGGRPQGVPPDVGEGLQ
jgi:hypothetical protein